MRERRASDWNRDLAARHGVEAEVELALSEHRDLRLLRSSTDSFDRLDFQLLAAKERYVELEVKAKNQPLSEGWRRLRPEVRPNDLFVLDELALRKIIDAGRYSFMLVRDVPCNRWFLWSVGDLLVASRVRYTRPLDVQSRRGKGKLLLDLAEAGHASTELHSALNALNSATSRLETWWRDISPWPTLEGATQ